MAPRRTQLRRGRSLVFAAPDRADRIDLAIAIGALATLDLPRGAPLAVDLARALQIARRADGLAAIALHRRHVLLARRVRRVDIVVGLDLPELARDTIGAVFGILAA